MSIRRNVGRFRVLVAALLLAISTLVALPAAAPPAHAQQGCAPGPNVIPTWSVLYDDRGVTLCQGENQLLPEAYVQIVDLAAGAKLRLISDPVDPQSPPAADNLYNKKEAGGGFWFDWIQSNVNTPAPSRLFSTTNASFFIDPFSAGPTELSLPEMSVVQNIQTLTLGWAFGDHSDAAWDALKNVLVLGNPTATQQNATIGSVPTHYTQFDVAVAFGLIQPDGQWYEGTVAFRPLYGISDPDARRTFVGVEGYPTSSKIWILTTDINVTLSEAQDILKSFGSTYEIQLDGGNSAQMYYEFDGDCPPVQRCSGEFRSPLGRTVPDVLAVYLAP